MSQINLEAAERPSLSHWPGSVQWLLNAVVIATFVMTFIVQAFQIPSESMENTLLIGDYLLVDKFRYGGGSFFDSILPYRQVHRGDIIVFHYPIDPSQHFVKRVVGIPGDHVRLKNQQVYINGVLIKEPYVHYSTVGHNAFRDEFPRPDILDPDEEGDWWLLMKKLVEDGQLIVPEGNYFALGDHRDDSKDSRYWGFVPRENIVGRPLIIYWSVRSGSDDLPKSPGMGDKLLHFAYAVTHLFQLTRWDRTLRLVR
jgi:signal peptidase I